MAIQQFKFSGEYNKSRSLEIDSEDTANLYVIKSEGKPDSMAPLPGIIEAFQLESGDNPCRDRGTFKIELQDDPGSNHFYTIAQDAVFRIRNEVVTLLQNRLTTTDGFISWANNTKQVAFTDGVKLYKIDFNSNTVDEVTSIEQEGFPPSPQMIYYQSARFFCTFKGGDNGSNIVAYSDFNDANTWNPLNFFVMNSLGDTTVGISGINQRAFIFGHNIIEIWEPVTYANQNPLLRDNNFNDEFGLRAAASLVKGVLDIERGKPVTSFLYWLSSNHDGVGIFVISYGGQPIKVSSDAVDLILRNLSVPNECVSIIYKESGHFFIENTWKTDNVTLVFDVNTGMWFRKIRPNGGCSVLNSHIYLNNKHYVTTTQNSKLYYLSDKYLTNDGEEIPKLRVTDIFRDPMGRRIRANFLEINFESGVLDALDDVPYAFLSWSADGGRTYNFPRKEQMGKIGQYKYQAQWFGLGIEYSYVFKLEVFSPVRVYIVDCYFDYDIGTR